MENIGAEGLVASVAFAAVISVLWWRRRDDVMIRVLLQYHADPLAVDIYGKTPLDIAREKRRTKSIALLKAAMR